MFKVSCNILTVDKILVGMFLIICNCIYHNIINHDDIHFRRKCNSVWLAKKSYATLTVEVCRSPCQMITITLGSNTAAPGCFLTEHLKTLCGKYRFLLLTIVKTIQYVFNRGVNSFEPLCRWCNKCVRLYKS